jgi:hypothetical protein
MYVRAKEFSLDKIEFWRSWKKTKYLVKLSGGGGLIIRSWTDMDGWMDE